MTIKQINAVLYPDSDISIIDTNGAVRKLNRHDPIEMTAYADFGIRQIYTAHAGIEIELNVIPVKEKD